MNAVQVCNLALARIGQDAISSLTLSDTSEAATACRLLFQPTLDALLREAIVWPWATRAVALVASLETVPGWGNVYQVPADCLRIVAVGDATSDPTRYPGALPLPPFRTLQAAAGGLLLATDQDAAWLWYVPVQTDTARADAAFCDLLAWRLAAELALALRAAPGQWQAATSGAREAYLRATAATANERVLDPPADAESILVRA